MTTEVLAFPPFCPTTPTQQSFLFHFFASDFAEQVRKRVASSSAGGAAHGGPQTLRPELALRTTQINASSHGFRLAAVGLPSLQATRPFKRQEAPRLKASPSVEASGNIGRLLLLKQLCNGSPASSFDNAPLQPQAAAPSALGAVAAAVHSGRAAGSTAVATALCVDLGAMFWRQHDNAFSYHTAKQQTTHGGQRHPSAFVQAAGSVHGVDRPEPILTSFPSVHAPRGPNSPALASEFAAGSGKWNAAFTSTSPFYESAGTPSGTLEDNSAAVLIAAAANLKQMHQAGDATPELHRSLSALALDVNTRSVLQPADDESETASDGPGVASILRVAQDDDSVTTFRQLSSQGSGPTGYDASGSDNLGASLEPVSPVSSATAARMDTAWGRNRLHASNGMVSSDDEAVGIGHSSQHACLSGTSDIEGGQFLNVSSSWLRGLGYRVGHEDTVNSCEDFVHGSRAVWR